MTKTILITGANSGIGKATALSLAAMGNRIVMLCRNFQKSEIARKEIIEKTNNHDIDLIIADLSLMSSVRTAAHEFHEKYDSLDVLINNAGTIFGKRTLTKEGLESSFTANYLGHFLLTALLFDSLKSAPEARIIHVASAAHKMLKKIDWDNLQMDRGYHYFRAYALSKLLNVIFSAELARRLNGTSITSNSLHPGVVGSHFGYNSYKYFKFFYKIARPFMRSVKKGAETPVYLAISPEVKNISGEYFIDKKIEKPSALAQNPEYAHKLWEISEQLCGISFL